MKIGILACGDCSLREAPPAQWVLRRCAESGNVGKEENLAVHSATEEHPLYALGARLSFMSLPLFSIDHHMWHLLARHCNERMKPTMKQQLLLSLIAVSSVVPGDAVTRFAEVMTSAIFLPPLPRHGWVHTCGSSRPKTGSTARFVSDTVISTPMG